MMKTISLLGAAVAISTAALVPATPAMAQRYHRGYHDHRDYRFDHDRRYYGRDRRYRGDHRCDSGTGGTIIGAIAGGLLGNTIAGHGDRTLGTVLGAGGGALAGRAIDRSDNPRYCRR